MYDDLTARMLMGAAAMVDDAFIAPQTTSAVARTMHGRKPDGTSCHPILQTFCNRAEEGAILLAVLLALVLCVVFGIATNALAADAVIVLVIHAVKTRL